jgi:phenylacetate-CoA ligase
MGDILMQVYQRLPRPARSAAATFRGAYLRWWRYGPRSKQLEHAAHEREYWNVERWDQETGERLAFVLHRAATRVPYYREQWAERRRRGDHAAWDILENWPLLDKETIRKNPRAFLADDCSPKRMFHQRTSGTTGTPLDLWRSRATLEAWYALAMARTRGWHGVERNDRWARLGGQLVVPLEQRQPPFWVWNAASRQLYMSTYHLAPDLIPTYLDALAKYRIVSMSVYTSSAFALAQEALRLGRDDLRMKVIFTNAEPLSAAQRETIGQAFHSAVRETYGMGEIVAGASECAEGRLHRWPEAGMVEILENGSPVPNGETGELVCTGLLNADMPLIRYRVGDYGNFAPGAESCACGRTLPMFGGIAGRTNDLLITADGRLVYWLNPVLYGIPVRQAQIVQETLGRIRVRYAPTPEFTAQNGRTMVERLRARMGDVDVELEELAEIPPSANGKLRAVVCEVPSEVRNAVLAQARS